MEQLTVKNIAKILNLVPDTILLVSADGTIAFPDEHGRFSDRDDVGSDEWAVEGSETSKRQSGSLTTTPGHKEMIAIPFQLRHSFFLGLTLRLELILRLPGVHSQIHFLTSSNAVWFKKRLIQKTILVANLHARDPSNSSSSKANRLVHTVYSHPSYCHIGWKHR